MTRWAAFVGLTVLVVTLLLVLARLSQTLVSDSTATSNGTRSRPFGDAARKDEPFSRRGLRRDPVVPRFESPSQATVRSGSDVPELSTGTLLANVAITQGLLGGLLAAGAFYFRVPLVHLGLGDSPLATGFLGLVVGVVFGLVLWLGNEAAGVLAEATGSGYDESLREMLAPDTLSGWVLLLGAVLPAIAFVEEFIFRAAAIGSVAAGFGTSPWALAVVSSLAFGVAHGAQGRAGIVVTGALGFALAAGFILTESLLVVVVAHYLVNAVEMVVHEGVGVDRLPEHI